MPATLNPFHLKKRCSAEHDLDKLDPQAARRILAFVHGRVARVDDPRSIGEALRRFLVMNNPIV